MLRVIPILGLILISLITHPLRAADDKVDSIEQRLEEEHPDSTRIKDLKALALELVYSDPEKAREYAERMLSLARKNDSKEGIGEAHHALGLSYYVHGDLDKCLDHWKKALDFRRESGSQRGVIATLGNMGVVNEEKGDYSKALDIYRKALRRARDLDYKELVANNHGNIGTVYAKKGHYPKALEHYFDALRIAEELGDKKLMADNRGNIGNIYHEQGNYSKALDNYKRSLKLAKELDNKRLMGNNLGNIGTAYEEKGDLSKALKYHLRSLRIKRTFGDKRGRANTLGNIGRLYLKGYDRESSSKEVAKDSLFLRGRDGEKIPHEELLDSALKVQKKAFELRKSLGDQHGLTFSLLALGKVRWRMGDTDKALRLFRRSYRIANEIGAMSRRMKASEQLHDIFQKKGNSDSALAWLERYTSLKDSVFNEEKQKALGKQEARYKFEKELLEQRKEQEKQAALARERNRRQRIIIYAGAGGLLMTLVFAFIVVNRLRVTRQQKRMIEDQKTLVEEKNQEITDSINYAKRLQEAILPPKELLHQHLKEHFILYKPKELVSGDFYFMDVVEEEGKKYVYYSAADCTGHGVPGAMVSIVGANGLKRCIQEFGLRDPGDILEKLSELVAEHFFQSEERIRDGMDLALCCLECEKSGVIEKVHYAGANNPLWIVNPDREEWPEMGKLFEQGGGLEIPATRKAIGYTEDPVPFASHSIELEKGDTLYTFSDGYPDQFGGDRGKKFKTANFKRLFLSIHDKSMEEQKAYIDRTFEEWRGNLEQIDDICVIGVRV